MLFEATALSAQQASGATPALPVPASTSTCGIKACREKHDTETQEDRRHCGMNLLRPPADLRQSMS